MQPASAEIAVVVVNYGTAALAIEAVESVLARVHGGRRVEIHLVDNASPGDDAQRLSDARESRGWGPAVTLHLETENHGFGRGNNFVLRSLAVRDTPPEKVFLLNPDARLDNEALDILASFLDAHPTVGAAGCGISLPGGSKVTAAFRFPTLLGEFESATNFGPISQLLRRFRTALPPDLPMQRVDWVAGAAVMFQWRALMDAGFFDPGYFLYYEEVDLMRTLHQKGWETWFLPEARAIHQEGAATGVGSGKTRQRRPAYVYESWRYYFLKNHGKSAVIAGAGLMMFGGTLNVLLSRMRGREPQIPLHFAKDTIRHVVTPSLHDRRSGNIAGERSLRAR